MGWVSNTGINVKATVDPLDALAEQNAGLSTAPDNLGLGKDLFEIPNFSTITGTGTNSNKAVLMNANGGSSGVLRAIRMTSANNQTAAIWSNLDNNYIDISKRQTIRMWMYFGPTQHKNAGDLFGDGMAFVLQNGDDPIAHSGKVIGNGESLGVWGIDNNQNADMPAFTSTAIPNSWALEFDTYPNQTDTKNGAADSFDIGHTKQHIAYGYPASAATYKQNIGGFISKTYDYQMNHTGYSEVALHDGQWHHLTIQWTPKDYSATISFNDKNPDGSKGTNPTVLETGPIDRTMFGKVPDNKMRWGFTASTGLAYQANLIAFESIPSSVEAETTAVIHDNTLAKDINSGETVNSGDSLSINYNLNYESGLNPWSNIDSEIVLPKNVTYVQDAKGDIGTVTYADGFSEPISITDVVSGTQKLNHHFTKDLDSAERNGITSATISLNVVADNVNSNTNVDSARSVIDSDNLIQDVDTPAFIIKKTKPMSLTLDQSNISVSPNSDATITGTVSYNDGTPITNSLMSVYTTLNGETLVNFVMTDSEDPGRFTVTVPADKLTEDTNTLAVFVADPAANMTNTAKVLISKKGDLSLTVNKAYEFGALNNVSMSHLISRKGNWDILVNDGREADPQNKWILSASTSKLTSGTNSFNGNMIFRNSNGIENILTNSDVNIANGVKTQEGQQITNIASGWDESDGIFLRSDGLSTDGTYQGEIDWTLSDTV